MLSKKTLFGLLTLSFLPLMSCSTGHIAFGSSYLTENKREVKRIVFHDYEFAYFDDGSGAIYAERTNEKLMETADCSFRSSSLGLIGNKEPLIDLVGLVGFPRFLGVSSACSLDFGSSGSDIYRAFFTKEMEYSSMDVLDYSDPKSWIDPTKPVLPTLSDLEKIKMGMSLDEVVSMIGKPQGSAGYGAIMFTFSIDDGSTLLTHWNPGEYNKYRNGPYYLAQMDLV